MLINVNVSISDFISVRDVNYVNIVTNLDSINVDNNDNVLNYSLIVVILMLLINRVIKIAFDINM